MAKRLKSCKMHSLSTLPNSRHHTTMLNTDVSKLLRNAESLICSKLSNDLISTQ